MMKRADADPYVGVRPYSIGDSEFFFGRARESWDLTAQLMSSRLVVLYGPPCVGKTSLIQAGVLANLGPEVAQVLPVVRLRGDPALPGAEAGHNRFVFTLFSSWVPETGDYGGEPSTVTDLLLAVPTRYDKYGDARLPLVVVIDQFEELFKDPGWDAEREEFLDQLAQTMEVMDDVHLLLSMRQHAVGQFLPYESVLSAGNRRSRFWLKPLDHVAALEALYSPLRATARSFAPGAAEGLVDMLRITKVRDYTVELRTVKAPFVHPLRLQAVASAMWRRLPEEVAVIGIDHCQNYGNTETILDDLCAETVRDVAVAQGVDECSLWIWLKDTFTTNQGTCAMAYEGAAQTAGMANEVARALDDRQLLRAEERAGLVWFELQTDALVEPIRRGSRLASGLAGNEEPARMPEAFLRLAGAALRSGTVMLAVSYGTRAVEVCEEAGDAGTLAESKFFLGKLVAAEARAETGARADELYAAAVEHLRQAAELFEREQANRAVGHVRAALGRLFVGQGRNADAVAELLGAVENVEDSGAIRLDLARAMNDLGQRQAAVDEYTNFLAATPEDTPAYVEGLIERATINADDGDPEWAQRDLDAAVRLSPDVAGRQGFMAARRRAFVRREARRP